MRKYTPLPYTIEPGTVVPVRRADGQEVEATVLASRIVGIYGFPQKWETPVRVPHCGGEIIECWLAAPGSTPSETVVVLIED